MKKLIFILAILLISIFVRTWKLNEYPVSLTMDEVAIGYGSFSLFHTGHDEKGNILPLAFYSVGDYKPPVNYYLLVPWMGWGGMNEWSVRLPVAILGSLSTLVFGGFTYRLFRSWKAAVFAGIWLSILPWHMHFSRYGLEAVTSLLFILLGMELFLRKTFLSFCFSFKFFILSIWAYHSSRLFVPLLGIFILISNLKLILQIVNSKKRWLTLFVIAFILGFPFLYLLFSSPAILNRAQSTSILRDFTLVNFLHHGTYQNISQFVFNNDWYLIFHHWWGKYLDYFDLRFLFWKGLSLTFPGYPDLGLMYFFNLPIALMGIWKLCKLQKGFIKSLIIFLAVTGPVSASLTMNDQHALRALVWLPFWGIVTVLGLSVIHKARWLLLLGAFSTYGLLYFHDIYTVNFPIHLSEYWQYGFKEIAQYTCQNLSKFDHIEISPTFGSEGPTTTGIPDYYVAFFCGQKELWSEKIGFARVNWDAELKKQRHTLLISGRWDYPQAEPPNEAVVHKINFKNGKPGFYFVDTEIYKQKHFIGQPLPPQL